MSAAGPGAVRPCGVPWTGTGGAAPGVAADRRGPAMPGSIKDEELYEKLSGAEQRERMQRLEQAADKRRELGY